MYPCRNHPHVLSPKVCSHCRHSYCDACLVEFLGQPHCGYCRDFRLGAMHAPARFNQKNHLRENLLMAAVVQLVVGGWLLNLGLLVPLGIIGATLTLTLIGALIAHIKGGSS